MNASRGMLLITVLIIALAVPSGVAEGAPCGGGSAETSFETLRVTREKQQVLAKYAKGVFLYRLGLGPAVSPPSWAADIQRACFVTFFTGKRVIACSGGFRPRTADIGKEVDANVQQALHMDQRAGRIDRATAMLAHVLITFPGEPRPVASAEMIDPVREGLFVENDRSGVAIVPGEAKTASWAYREALRRLGESDPSKVRLYVFDSWVISGKD
ncbi:MAG: AMMECR1 domain-containing protein [Geobacter sp.]|nr:MAG: AMMECR1 domain-containing protein [Geobacter sp.]